MTTAKLEPQDRQPTHLEPVPWLLLLLLLLLHNHGCADSTVVLHSPGLFELAQLAAAVRHCQQHQAEPQAAPKSGQRC